MRNRNKNAWIDAGLLSPFLLIALVWAGCKSDSAESKPPVAAASPAATQEAPKSDTGHEHTAPHGGLLVELGEEFAHLEIVLDSATGKLTAYALDGEAEKAVRIKQPGIEIQLKDPAKAVTLTGVANSLTGETASDTSEFSSEAGVLKGRTEFDGTIKAVTIKGKQFSNLSFTYPKGTEAH